MSNRPMTTAAILAVLAANPDRPGASPLFNVDHSFNGKRSRMIDPPAEWIRNIAMRDPRYVIYGVEPNGQTREGRTESMLAFYANTGLEAEHRS